MILVFAICVHQEPVSFQKKCIQGGNFQVIEMSVHAPNFFVIKKVIYAKVPDKNPRCSWERNIVCKSMHYSKHASSTAMQS